MPQLHLDLDILEANAKIAAAEIAAMGKNWRPHVKAHRQPAIAKILVDLGAIGVTAANVVEVEAMAAAGIPSILLAHLVVDPDVIDRLAACSKQTELILCIDHFVHAELLSAAAVRNDVTFNVLVDVNVGMNRTGCRPRVDAAQLWLAACELPGIQVKGIMGYEGHLMFVEDQTEKRDSIRDAMNALEQTRDEIERHGETCEIVSGGGSGGYRMTGQHPAVTELQAGGLIFGDVAYVDGADLPDLGCALTVTADIVSRPSLDQAVANCGRKANDPTLRLFGAVNQSGVDVVRVSAEHTVMKLSGDGRDLQIGDPVRFSVAYSDRTILLHDRIHVFRGADKVDEWPVLR